VARISHQWRNSSIRLKFSRRSAPSVTVFGSARLKRTTTITKRRLICPELAKNHLGVHHRRRPESWRSANRGAHDAKGKSVGLNIELPFEQKGNRFANVPVHFHYFFSRKVLLPSNIVLVLSFMPGGFGNALMSFFEVLTLVQTRRIPRFPLILFGSKHWAGLKRWMKNTGKKRVDQPRRFGFVCDHR